MPPSKIRASGQVVVRRRPGAAVLPGPGVEHIGGVADVDKAMAVAGVEEHAGQQQQRQGDGQRAPVRQHGGDDTPKLEACGKKPGYPACAETIYARSLGLHPRFGKRIIQKLGGVARCKALPDHVLVLLLRDNRVGFKRWQPELAGVPRPTIDTEARTEDMLRDRGLA